VYTVTCGEIHAAALSLSHTLLTWGGGKYGQLGLGDNVKQISTPQTVQLPISLSILQVSCVEHNTYALTKCGHIFSCGANDHRQTGTGDTEMVHTIRFVNVHGENRTRFVMIAAGSNFCLAIAADTRCGKRYGWGSNMHGQLGYNLREYRNTPIQIQQTEMQNATWIVCGSSHRVVGIESGNLFGFGKNSNGQLGLGLVEQSMTPVRIQTLCNVRTASCGFGHTVVVCNDGGVWSSGQGSKFALGHGPMVMTSSNSFSNRLMPICSVVVQYGLSLNSSRHL